MTVVSATATIVRRSAPSNLATSYADAPAQIDHVIVIVEHESGITGIGEATPVPEFTGETVQQVDQSLQRHLLPAITGRSAFDMAGSHQIFDQFPGGTSARAAVDMALYDLQGKLTGQPFYNLLGGKVRNSVEVSFPIGICDIPDAVELATSALERGITTLKLKVGRDVRADVARLKAVRETVGPDVNIRVDANGIYSVAEAIRIIDRLAPFDLQFVEQPVRAGDVTGLAEVRRQSQVPIMADEGVRSLRDAVELIDQRAVDHLAIKLISVGGIFQALPVIRLAAAREIGVVVSSPSDTQIGAAAVLALALVAPTGDLAHELRVFDSQPDLAHTAIKADRGSVWPAADPGLGVHSIAELAVGG